MAEVELLRFEHCVKLTLFVIIKGFEWMIEMRSCKAGKDLRYSHKFYRNRGNKLCLSTPIHFSTEEFVVL